MEESDPVENESNNIKKGEEDKEPKDQTEVITTDSAKPKDEPDTTKPNNDQETKQSTESPKGKEKKNKGKSKAKPDSDSDAGPNAEIDSDKKNGKPEQNENPDFNYMIRIANTNVDGNQTIPLALTSIKGIGDRLGNTIADKLELPRDKKVGDMTDEEVDRLIEIVNELNNDLPSWMKNRQKDFDSGEDIHIISTEIQSTLRDDLNRLKKIRCYRGIRHEQGQKVRGQRTRANGRTGITIGVMKKRVKQQQQKSGKPGK